MTCKHVTVTVVVVVVAVDCTDDGGVGRVLEVMVMVREMVIREMA